MTGLIELDLDISGKSISKLVDLQFNDDGGWKLSYEYGDGKIGRTRMLPIKE